MGVAHRYQELNGAPTLDRWPVRGSAYWQLLASRLPPYFGPMQEGRPKEWKIMQARRALSDDEWRVAKIKFRRGTHVQCSVLSHHPFGFFVDLGQSVNGIVELLSVIDPPRPGPSSVRGISYVGTDVFPAVGTDIEGVVVGVAEHNRQIQLSMRPSDLARDDWANDRW